LTVVGQFPPTVVLLTVCFSSLYREPYDWIERHHRICDMYGW
jgi:hypothetical protein